jgi:hypothetical protein
MKRRLPCLWEWHWSAQHNCELFFNTETSESTWDDPRWQTSKSNQHEAEDPKKKRKDSL